MGKYNKLWVAVAMMAGNFIRDYWGIDLGVDETTASLIVGGLGSIAIWAVPNT